MKSLFIISASLLLITAFTVMPAVYAGEDEEEDEDENEEENEEGGIALGSGTGNIILYGTIAAIIAAIGYSGFKIVSSRKKASTKSP
jgi:hypothetical protein